MANQRLTDDYGSISFLAQLTEPVDGILHPGAGFVDLPCCLLDLLLDKDVSEYVVEYDVKGRYQVRYFQIEFGEILLYIVEFIREGLELVTCLLQKFACIVDTRMFDKA